MSVDSEAGDSSVEILVVGVILIILMMLVTSVIVVNRDVGAVHRMADDAGVVALRDSDPAARAEILWAERLSHAGSSITCNPLSNIDVQPVDGTDWLQFDYACEIASGFLGDINIESSFSATGQQDG